MNRRHALAATFALGVTTISAVSLASAVRTSLLPYAWILSGGQVLAWNMTEMETEEIVEHASMLINYPEFRAHV